MHAARQLSDCIVAMVVELRTDRSVSVIGLCALDVSCCIIIAVYVQVRLNVPSE